MAEKGVLAHQILQVMLAYEHDSPDLDLNLREVLPLYSLEQQQKVAQLFLQCARSTKRAITTSLDEEKVMEAPASSSSDRQGDCGTSSPHMIGVLRPSPDVVASTWMEHVDSAYSPLQDSQNDCAAEVKGTCSSMPHLVLNKTPQLHALITQSLEEFISDSLDNVRKCCTHKMDPRVYEAVLEWNVGSYKWTDGHQWLDAIVAGKGSKRQGAIYYALAAMGFSLWFDNQEKAQDMGSSVIIARLLATANINDDAMKQARKNIATYRSRGKKWRDLVKRLGHGILVINPWGLGKCSSTLLEKIVQRLSGCEEKIILDLLSTQFSMFVHEGSADYNRFVEDMKKAGFTLPGQQATGSVENQVRTLSQQAVLQVRDSQFAMHTDVLNKGEISADMALCCLHLSDRMPSVQVGFACYEVDQSNGEEIFHQIADCLNKWSSPSLQAPIGLFLLRSSRKKPQLLEVDSYSKRVIQYTAGREDTFDPSALAKGTFPDCCFTRHVVPLAKASEPYALEIIYETARNRLLLATPGHITRTPSEIRTRMIDLLSCALEVGMLVPQRRRRKV